MKKILAILGILFLAACVTVPQQGPQQNAIVTQGMSEFDVAPDIAKVRFRIWTNDSLAQGAQEKNRMISDAVRSALLASGVQASDIETTDYRVERWQDWDYKTQMSVDRGYQVNNAFVITTRNMDAIGKILDAGIGAGANNVESISFELSEIKDRETKTEALRMATQNAREKAEALAEGAGVQLGKLLSVTENNYGYIPYARYDVMASKAEAGGAPLPATDISPQNVHVSAQVSLSYDIK